MDFIKLRSRPLYSKVVIRENAAAAPERREMLGEPYTKKKVGGKWKVYKADSDGKPTGKALGTHDDEKSANDQIKALHANEMKSQIKSFGEEVEDLAESYFDGMSYYEYEPTYGAITWDGVLTAEEAVERTRLLRKRTVQMMTMVMDTIYMETAPLPALKSIFNGYLELAGGILGEDMDSENRMPAEVEVGERYKPTITVQEIETFDNYSLDVPATLAEADIEVIQDSLDKAPVLNERRRPLYVDIQVIEPGWGNEADNHYYSAEMLKEFGYVFTGAKMFETDHRAEEKSTRTWVSTAVGLQGFTETGAPVQRVFVHDPDFAEKLRNLNDEKLLGMMECSIFATGTVENEDYETEDGRIGRRVMSLDEGAGIDWVTQAGAGGKALSLVESTKGGSPMPPKHKKKDDEVVDAAEAETTTIVTIRESDLDDDQEVTTDEEAPEVTTDEENQEDEEEDETSEESPDETDEEQSLEAAEVQAIVNETNLPDPTKARLNKGHYSSLSELKAVVEEAVAEVKAITGSGRVFGFNSEPILEGEGYTPLSEKELKEAEKSFQEKYHLSS